MLFNFCHIRLVINRLWEFEKIWPLFWDFSLAFVVILEEFKLSYTFKIDNLARHLWKAPGPASCSSHISSTNLKVWVGTEMLRTHHGTMVLLCLWFSDSQLGVGIAPLWTTWWCFLQWNWRLSSGFPLSCYKRKQICASSNSFWVLGRNYLLFIVLWTALNSRLTITELSALLCGFQWTPSKEDVHLLGFRMFCYINLSLSLTSHVAGKRTWFCQKRVFLCPKAPYNPEVGHSGRWLKREEPREWGPGAGGWGFEPEDTLVSSSSGISLSWVKTHSVTFTPWHGRWSSAAKTSSLFLIVQTWISSVFSGGASLCSKPPPVLVCYNMTEATPVQGALGELESQKITWRLNRTVWVSQEQGFWCGNLSREQECQWES